MKHPDYDRAFHETPEYIRSAIELGFVKGKKAMKMRYKITSALSIAAMLAVILGAAAFGASRLGGQPDNRIPTPLSNSIATEEPGQLSWTPSPRPAATPEPTREPTVEPTEEIEGTSLDTVYYTNSGLYFHIDPYCSGMQNAIEGSVQDAYHDAKEPCPNCLADWIFEVRAVPAGSTPAPTASDDAFDLQSIWPEYDINEVDTVFVTPAGGYFHYDPVCSGMTDAEETVAAIAYLHGMKPCPVCTPAAGARAYLEEPAATVEPTMFAAPLNQSEEVIEEAENASENDAFIDRIFYATPNGNYYHTQPTCSGMQGATAQSLNVVISSGKRHCPVCIGGDVASYWLPAPESADDFVFFFWDGGNEPYYHVDPECSGREQVGTTTLGGAEEMGCVPCPVCLASVNAAAAD